MGKNAFFLCSSVRIAAPVHVRFVCSCCFSSSWLGRQKGWKRGGALEWSRHKAQLAFLVASAQLVQPLLPQLHSIDLFVSCFFSHAPTALAVENFSDGAFFWFFFSFCVCACLSGINFSCMTPAKCRRGKEVKFDRKARACVWLVAQGSGGEG